MQQRKHSHLIILFCLYSLFSFAQIQESEAIDKIFFEWNQPNTPGCALGIMKDGELAYAKGYGLANMEYDIPNSAHSVFRIGSTSKQFTAACIVLLAEQGKLDLDNTLSDYFSEFPAYAETITIRHLLNHTSGIRDYLQLAYLKGLGDDDYYTDENLMDWLVNQTDLNFAPGDEYMYSNSGYWLLGQIVGVVSGMNMADYAKKEIFDPLGMAQTHFHNDHTRIVKNRASGYVPSEDDNYSISMTTLNMIGDGGIFTTVNDIKKWDDAYYNSEVLSRNFWEMMTKRGVLNSGEEIKYASGLMIGEYKGLKTISHGGAFVGFRAEMLRFPDQKLSIAIFANRGDANPTRMAYQVADILLKDKLIVENKADMAQATLVLPVEEIPMSQFVGDYEIQPGVVISMSIKNDSLTVLQKWDDNAYIIVKTNGNTYQIPGEDGLSFTFSDLADGQTNLLTVIQGGETTKAPRIEEIDLAAIKLTDYTGSYYSSEMDVTYKMVLVDGALTTVIDDKQSHRCTVVNVDQVNLPLGLVRFQRLDGAVSGFELDSGRVKNLKFVKKK